MTKIYFEGVIENITGDYPVINNYAVLRSKALDEAYAIPNYENMNDKEKTNIYDKIVVRLKKAMKLS